MSQVTGKSQTERKSIQVRISVSDKPRNDRKSTQEKTSATKDRRESRSHSIAMNGSEKTTRRQSHVAYELQSTQKSVRKTQTPQKLLRQSQALRKSSVSRKSQGLLQKLSISSRKSSKSANFSKSQIFSSKASFRQSHVLSKSQNLSKLKSKESWLKRRSCTFGLTERFNNIGFHPGLDKSGAMKKDVLQLAPGQYTYDDKPVCMYKKYQKKSAWKRETECEEFSKTLGYRNAEILKNRVFMSKHLGPGSHNISSEIFKKQDNNVCPNHGFGSQKKFKCDVNLVPPPGTYFYNITTANIRPAIKFLTEERFANKEKPWSLAPNRYEIKSSLKELLDKVVSKRGPYDLFTGDRGNNNTYNKLAVTNSCAPDKIYDLPSDLDYLLYDKQKRRTGKFFRAARFPRKPTIRMMLMDPSTCYKNPLFPGPDRYTLPGGIRIVAESKNSFFGTSKIELRPGLPWTTMPGPGRYNANYPKCSQGKCGTWVFKSKSKQRAEYKKDTYNAF